MKDLRLSASTSSYVKQEIDKLVASDNTKDWRVSFTPWKEKRGISANNQQHLWYAQIASYNDDMSALDVKNECKDMFGLPILLLSREHGDKIDFLLEKLDYYRHSKESQMKLIQCLEVTSLFNTAESKVYMDNMVNYYNSNGKPIKFKD